MFKNNSSLQNTQPIGCVIRKRSDNALRPESVVTTDHLGALLFRRVEGPAGDKLTEEPHKDGTALVPVIVDWATPQCSCIVGQADPCPFDKKPYIRPQDRHRANHSVLAMAPAIWLDVDDTPRAEVDRLLDRLDGEGLAFTAWSSHSYGRKGDQCPMRLVVWAEAPYSPEVCKSVRYGFATRYGIKLDRACLHPASLFYAPSCPADPARIAAAWLRHGKGARRVNALDYAAEGMAARPARERPSRDATAAEPVSLEALQTLCAAHPDAWQAKRLSSALTGEAWTWPEDPVRAIGTGRHGVLQSIANWVYANADKDFDPAGFWPVLRDSSIAVGEYERDGRIVEAHEVTGLFQWAFANVARESEDGGRDLVISRLQSADFERVTRTDAEQTIRSELDKFYSQWCAARDSGQPRPVLVLSATPGFGKTHITRDAVAQWARDLHQETVWAAPSHALLEETAARFPDLGVVPTYRASGSAETERRPTCLRKPELKPWIDAGVQLKRHFCPTCPRAAECGVPKYNPPRRGILELVPHALIESSFREQSTTFGTDQKKDRRAAEHNGTVARALLVVDEEFQTHEIMRLDRAQLMALAADLRGPAGEMLSVETRFGAIARADAALAGRPFDAAEDWLSPAGDNAPPAAFLRGVRTLLAWDGKAGALVGGGLEVRTASPIWHVLGRVGGIILSATPTVALWARAGVSPLVVHVEDSHPTAREIDYRADSNRRGVLGAGLEHALERTTREVRKAASDAVKAGVRRLLVVTYQQVAAMLDLDAEALGLEALDLAHYGGIVGLDRWRDYDGCVTVWDPWTNLDATAMAGRDVWYDLAAAELAQAHGRLRDCAPTRAKGGWHRHVGAVVPLGWGEDNADVLAPAAAGRPKATANSLPLTPGDLDRAAALAGGVGALGRMLGVGPKQVQLWRCGSRPVPAKYLGPLLDCIGLANCEGLREGLRRDLAALV